MGANVPTTIVAYVQEGTQEYQCSSLKATRKIDNLGFDFIINGLLIYRSKSLTKERKRLLNKFDWLCVVWESTREQTCDLRTTSLVAYKKKEHKNTNVPHSRLQSGRSETWSLGHRTTHSLQK